MSALDVLLVGPEDQENLATRYLVACLRQAGYTAETAAFTSPDDTDAVRRLVRARRPRLVGLSDMFQFRALELLDLARHLKDDGYAGHITIGGHFPTFAYRELLRDGPGLDSIVRGEGEETIVELVARLDDPAHWAEIRGLAFRAADGRIVETPPRPLIDDLDSIPFPARDAAPMTHMGIPYAPILGSRGCYRNCSFCSIRAFYEACGGKRVQRWRSVPNLVAEMAELRHRWGVRLFIFNDDEFFIPGHRRHEHAQAFGAALRDAGLTDIAMSIKCRADDVAADAGDEELFQYLKTVGVVRVYVGVESGSQHSLDTFNKRTTVAQNYHALEVLNRLDILADFGMLMFDPNSTVDDIRANIDYLWAMGGEGQAPIIFARMEVYAGTPILHTLAEQGRLIGNYLAWDYEIPDPRVELLYRLMVLTFRRRNYDFAGLQKVASQAFYELLIYRYLYAHLYDPAVEAQLRDLAQRMNRHSLAVFQEMFDFVLDADIHDAGLVNRRAAAWATDINRADMDLGAELDDWRVRLHRLVGA
ncbi:MAG: cobalamin-dependent protein [Chloroflexi bacterium]|nr:cobalamin-dependent protein [Chloroflexota bacterium]MBU1748851.1 cobalamin-dependent protein [Chloroflexota bacterium]